MSGHQGLQRSLLVGRVGGIAKIVVGSDALVDDALQAREGLEPCLSVVSADSAISDASEGQVAVGDVQDGVVDAAAAERDLAQHALLRRLLGGKQVERQR